MAWRELGGWDDALLAGELQELMGEGFDLGLWQQFTGETALREAEGSCIEEVRAARRAPDTSAAVA